MQSTTSKQVDHQSSSLSQDTNLVLAIIDEYVRRKDAGECPTIAEYEAICPHMATRIRETLVSLEAMDAAMGGREPVPEQIAGCKILRVVGTGAMGTVYEAQHPRVSRRLAIKTLKHGGNEERFPREAEILSRLTHPNIVPFMDYGQDRGTHYLTMHFIEGVSLDVLLETHWQTGGQGSGSQESANENPGGIDVACNFQRLARMGASVASALHYAHSHGVIHRDVKPGNLLLDPNGKIWVSDFGLAKVLGEGSKASLAQNIVGTPRYMAPEQVRGICSHQSDIYSLGITLYELASGERAWDAVSRRTLPMARRSLEIPDLAQVAPHVPAPLARVIMRACAFKPEDRYPTAAELEDVLIRFASTGKQGDRRKRSRYPGQKYVRRQPLIIAGTILAGLIAGAFWPVGNAPQQEEAYWATLDRVTEPTLHDLVPSWSESLEDDTPENRELRRQVAENTVDALKSLWDHQAVSQEDRAELDSAVRTLSETLADGSVPRDGLRQETAVMSRDSEKMLMAGFRDLNLSVEEQTATVGHINEVKRLFEQDERKAIRRVNEVLLGYESSLDPRSRSALRKTIGAVRRASGIGKRESTRVSQ